MECYLFIFETFPIASWLWYLSLLGAYFVRWFTYVGLHWHFRTRHDPLNWTSKCLCNSLKSNPVCFWKGNTEVEIQTLRVWAGMLAVVVSSSIHPLGFPHRPSLTEGPHYFTASLFWRVFSLPHHYISSLSAHATPSSLYPNALTKVISDLQVTKPGDIF